MPKFWLFGQSSDAKKAEEAVNLPAEEPTEPLCNKEDEIKDSDSKNNVKENSTELPIVYYAVSLPGVYHHLSSESTAPSEYVPTLLLDQGEALKIIKEYAGARFKTFNNIEEAKKFSSLPAECHCPAFECKTFFDFLTVKTEKCSTPNAEKGGTTFRLPKRPDVVELRKSITSGDCQQFQTTIWENPRFLINLGDTPMVYYEGYRYNALHVAAKSKQPGICKVILKTIEDPKFMELLYPEDTMLVTRQRVDYVLDLYLNMPEKRLCETPLHFAAKFGCLESVQCLASHPFCDKKRKNKYGLTAREIICERCPSASIDFKQQIEEAFEAQFFVPVLRSQDNSIQPFIGKPCLKKELESYSQEISGGPCKETLSVMAMAGPMSPKQAKTFYKSLKTPTISKVDYQQISGIRLCDVEKGVERFGRDLAHDMKTSWTEYWSCLNSWCDLSSKEGLDTLEVHLASLHNDLKVQNGQDNLSRLIQYQSPIKSPKSDVSSGSGGIHSLCSHLESLHISDYRSIITSPDMPHLLNDSSHFNPDFSKDSLELSIASPDSYCFGNKLNDSLEIIGNGHFDMNELFPSKQTNSEENVCLNDRNGVICKEEGIVKSNYYLNNKLFHHIVVLILEMFYLLSTMIDLVHVDKINELAEEVLPQICDMIKLCGKDIKEQPNVHKYLAYDIHTGMCEQFSSRERDFLCKAVSLYLSSDIVQSPVHMDNALDTLSRKHLRCILRHICRFLSDHEKVALCSCLWSVTKRPTFDSCRQINYYATNKDSGGDKEDSSEEDDLFYTPPSSPVGDSNAVTPDEGLEVYIHGNTPSKDDLDLLRAIKNIYIDVLRYPHIHRWMHLISTKDENTKESWLSPAVKDFRISRRNISAKNFTLNSQAKQSTPLACTPKRVNNFFSKGRQPKNLSRMIDDLDEFG